MAQTKAYRPTPKNPTIRREPQQSGRVASDGTDEMLDEIDAALEENALETVRTYVQRGGQ